MPHSFVAWNLTQYMSSVKMKMFECWRLKKTSYTNDNFENVCTEPKSFGGGAAPGVRDQFSTRV